MSHSEQDPTTRLIHEIAASMGGQDGRETSDHILRAGDQPPIIGMQPGVILDQEDGYGGYRGLADELLLSAGQVVIDPRVRDALAEHIGSGIVSGLLQSDGKGDPTERVVLEVSAALRDGSLLSNLQEEVDFINESRKNSTMGPIARWRQNRRRAAEEAEAAKQHYRDRQDALQRLRHRTYERGEMSLPEGMHEGDNVEFFLTCGEKALAASSRIRGKVVGHVEDEPLHWKGGRAIYGVVLEVEREERANPENFIYESIPKGARIVVYGGAMPDNTMRGDHINKAVRGLTPIIGWEGEALKLVSRGKGLNRDNPMLTLDQVVINEIPMFNDKEAQIKYHR